MAWDFETDPEYQEKLDWAAEFVREEIEPLDLLCARTCSSRRSTTTLAQDHRPAEGRGAAPQGLWATHLGPELGGQGYGQLKLALLNEILGRSQWAPIVFGSQAPDTGNAEIIAHYGTAEQKERYLRRCSTASASRRYSMTEPHAGADPTLFTTRAVKDGDEWVINGWKYFSSNAKTASFLIVMVVTNPDVSAVPGHVDVPRPDRHARRQHRAQRRPLRRADERGLARAHPLRRRPRARGRAARRRGPGVRRSPRPASAAAASTTPCAPSGWPRRRIDMMCERALSRETQGSLLADKQFVQGYIADSYAQLAQFRLFVLYTAWEIDKYNDYRRVRKDIATAKVVMPTVLHDIAWRAMQVHGALGTTNEMPFFRMIHGAGVMGLADGPTEVHKVTVARQVLRDYRAHRRHVAHGVDPRQARSGARRSSPTSWSSRSATCERGRRVRSRRRGPCRSNRHFGGNRIAPSRRMTSPLR